MVAHVTWVIGSGLCFLFLWGLAHSQPPLVRWFNEALEPVPLTLTLLVLGVAVIPAMITAALWAALWVGAGCGFLLGLSP